MSKFIIREVEPEACDFSFYFDDDGLTEASGDFCNTLFIVPSRDFRGFNGDVYENVCRSALELSDMFEDIKFKGYYSSFYNSFKDCMIDNGIPYTSKKCHDLKSVLLNFDESPESVAAFLSVTTGKKWGVSSAYGYCQGDYVQMVYCPERYPDGVRHYGEVYLGAAKEFCVIEIDENGEEVDSVYGFIVADCQARNDAECKRLVCEWYGCSVDDARLEMIDGSTTRTFYTYRTA